MNLTPAKIEKMIYVVRGMNVMTDFDLAELYGVDTKALNQAVKRNRDRFPDDFMFECNFEELNDLRSQFVTANQTSNWNHMRRNLPMVFTESGVAMLSSVLNSPKAIQINISIMRIFIKLRSFHMMEEKLNSRMDKMESGTNKAFKIVFERLDTLENEAPSLKPVRKKIGLK